MDNQVDVKFRLKQRKVRGSQSKREGLSTENVLITMRVTYLSMRLEFSTGYHIDVLRWDQNAERAIGPNRDGQSADEINGGIMRLARNVRDTAHMFEEMEKVPTQEQFRETFEQIRAEEQQHIELTKITKPRLRQKTTSPLAFLKCSMSTKEVIADYMIGRSQLSRSIIRSETTLLI